MKLRHIFDQYKSGDDNSVYLKHEIKQEIHDMKRRRDKLSFEISKDIEYLQKTYNLFDNSNKWKKIKKIAVVTAALCYIGFTSYFMNDYQKAKEDPKRTTIEYSEPQKPEKKRIIDYNRMATQKEFDLFKQELERKQIELQKEKQAFESYKQRQTADLEKKVSSLETRTIDLQKRERRLNQKKEGLEEKLNSQYNPVIKKQQLATPAEIYDNKNNYIPISSKNLLVSVHTGQGFKYLPVRGDTLWQIAEDIYGSGREYVKIKRANNLTTDTIEVNQILNIPSGVKNKTHLIFENIDCFKYTAKKYDTLYSISSKIYGSVNYAKKILEFNRQINPRFSEKIWGKELVYLPLKMEK